MFCALVAVADHDSEAWLLERLEAMPAPDLAASEAHGDVRASFVPTNRLFADRDTTTLLGRTNSEQVWARSFPRHPVVEYRWPDESWSDNEVRTLATVARRVPYVGRATSPAIVTVATEQSDHQLFRVLTPYRSDFGDQFAIASSVRVPFPGSLAALQRIHEAKAEGGAGDPWQVGQWVDYGFPRQNDEPPVPGPYSEMVVLRLERSIDGRNTAAVTRQVRRTLMARTGNPSLPALTGHHDGTVRQIAVVGLVDVGHENARGELRGIGICLPHEMTPAQLVRVASALPASGETLEVRAGRLGVIALRRVVPGNERRLIRTLDIRWWSSPSTMWTTVLPLVTDRFLKRGDSVVDEMRRIIHHAGLPPLRRIVARDRRPLIPGGVDLHPRDTLRRPSDSGVKPYFHATFELERPVRGPVVVGSMRHYGLGLCIPTQVQVDNE